MATKLRRGDADCCGVKRTSRRTLRVGTCPAAALVLHCLGCCSRRGDWKYKQTLPSRERFSLERPEGRRRLWRVRGPRGYWACDSEAIARELLRRLKAGKAPGFVARDLRRMG